MQLYFVKATYTNNVYKISDFFTSNKYKTLATQMLDINFKPDEGVTSFITSKIKLPNEYTIDNYTHFVVPDYEKIYRIISIDYLNSEQWKVNAEEDPLLSNFQTLKTTDLILQRTNDATKFRGINDVANVSIERTAETKMIPSPANTGKWLLIFMQYNSDKTKYGFKFDKSISPFGLDPDVNAGLETFDLLSDMLVKYPPKVTTTPNAYSYYQKTVLITPLGLEWQKYQCVYDGTKLFWSKIVTDLADGNLYYKLSDWQITQLNSSDIKNIIFALPFNSVTNWQLNQINLVTARSFVGMLDPGEVLDIKLVDDIILPIKTVSRTLVNSELQTNISLDDSAGAFAQPVRLYTNDLTETDFSVLTIFNFRKEIDLNVSLVSSPLSPTKAEPFYHYRLYVYGQEFTIPSVLVNKVKLLIAPNSGTINYIVYYENEDATTKIISKNIIGSGSFTHSIRWQIDKLDEFYNQNPTYKEQYFANMIARAVKGITTGTIGGALGGSVAPGIGTAIGATVGLGTSIVNAGLDASISAMNLYLEEKGRRLQPDQAHGDNTDLAIQLANRFGIYWNCFKSTNIDLMKMEYDLKGFPTSIIANINALTQYTNDIFGSCKIVYGQLKEIVKNDYVTRFINKKLTEGVIIIE